MNHPDEAASVAAPLSDEALSCLIDGELDPAETARLLRLLGTDRRARRKWLLLHLAGDALRSSEVASLQSERFLLRMRDALQAEPTLIAPRIWNDRARLVRRVALPGVAVAAAAVMLAIFVVPQSSPDAPSTYTARIPAPTAPVAVPVAANPGTGAANDVRRLDELEAYLAAHRELAGGAMMPPAAPYLRASATAQR